MRTRIGAAVAVLVIGTAAWALAQREERSPLRRETAPPATIYPASEAPELPAPSPSSPVHGPARALRRIPVQSLETPTLPAPTPAHPTPDAVATNVLATAKAEIQRLEQEKRKAEQELARAQARIQAAEAGMAKWRSLLEAVSGVLGAPQGDATVRSLPPPVDEPNPLPPPVDETPLDLPVEETRAVEVLPGPTDPVEVFPALSSTP